MRCIRSQVLLSLSCGLFCVTSWAGSRAGEFAEGKSLGGPLRRPWIGQLPAVVPGAETRRVAEDPRVIHPGRYPAFQDHPHSGHDSDQGMIRNPRSAQQPLPVVIPQIYGYPPTAPAYEPLPNPAVLSGQIEIVPNYVTPPRSRSRATYQIVPTDPLPQIVPEVEILPSPPRPGYFELPPPPY